ncbi:MAG: hypothetical protein P8X66_02995 [Maritimibacter sp.]
MKITFIALSIILLLVSLLLLGRRRGRSARAGNNPTRTGGFKVSSPLIADANPTEPIKIDDASWHEEAYEGEPDELPSFAVHIGLFFQWCADHDGLSDNVRTDPMTAPLLGQYFAGELTATELIDQLDGKLFAYFLKPPVRDFALAYYAPESKGVGGANYLDDYAKLTGPEFYLSDISSEFEAQVFALLDARYRGFTDAQTTAAPR